MRNARGGQSRKGGGWRKKKEGLTATEVATIDFTFFFTCGCGEVGH